MKLEISREEIEGVLLDWVDRKWPNVFNTVEIDSNYSTVRRATFTKEEPAKIEQASE